MSMTCRIKLLCVISVSILIGCQQEVKKTDGAAQANTQDQNLQQPNINTQTGGRTFYAGFDGANDYSLILPGFRQYTIADPSVATITEEQVTLSQDTIEELIAGVKNDNPNFTDEMEQRLRDRMGRQETAYRLTPLKAGTTSLSTSRGGRGGQDTWGSNDVQIQLVVNEYTSDQYSAGQQRYTSEGSGLLKACKSCHETGAEDAPPHELGNIKEISDAQGLQWIKTGTVNNRTASITHTWEFSSADQEQGILPFLRAKASKDVETFTKLIFEERFANFDPSQGPPRPGGQ